MHMRIVIVCSLVVLSVTACHPSSETSQTSTAVPAKDDSMAARAGEAGLRARKKAEALKAAEDAKTKQTNDAGNQ